MVDRFYNASVGNKISDVRTFVRNGTIVDVDTPTSFRTIALHGAALRGHRQVVDFLLDNGADINGRQEDGATPLLAATFGGQEVLAQHLLALGARGNESNASGAAPLHGAALLGYPKLARTLIEAGVDVEHADESNITALHGAAMSGRTGIAKLLLNHGATVDARTADGQSPLHYACAGAGSPGVVKALLTAVAFKADPDAANMQSADTEHAEASAAIRDYINERDGLNRTALHWCSLRGFNDTLIELLKLGGDATLRDKDGMTPLALAFEPQHSWVVKALLDAGAPGIELPDLRGRTVLHWAAERGFPQLTDRLLNFSAPIDAVDRNGMTAAHLAARKGHGAVLQVLHKRGADLLLLDVRGWSVMHYGALSGSQYATLLLAGEGVLLTTRTVNNEKLAPLHIACRSAKVGFVKELLEFVSAVNQRDAIGRTPLHHCVERANVDAVEALVKAGADVSAVDDEGMSVLDIVTAWSKGEEPKPSVPEHEADAAADDGSVITRNIEVRTKSEPKLNQAERRQKVAEVIRSVKVGRMADEL